MSQLPVFSSPFLNHFCRELEGRTKALSHLGKLTWATQQPGDFEWLTVYFTPVIGNYCIFQFVEDNRANVFIRSRKRKNRGKVLLRIEDMKLVDNAEALVYGLEVTVINSYRIDADKPGAAVSTIRAAWSMSEVRVGEGGG